MKSRTPLLLALAISLSPLPAAAQSIQQYLFDIGEFFNSTIIPILLTIAFVFFIWHTARYFIFETDNEKVQENARQQALLGIGSFIFIVSLWGIVTLFAQSFGFLGREQICFDYVTRAPGPCRTVPPAIGTPLITGGNPGTNPPNNPGTPADPVDGTTPDPFDEADWQDEVTNIRLGLAPQASCPASFLPTQVEFYLTSPSIDSLVRLQYAKALLLAGLVTQPQFNRLLSLYNQSSGAGLLEAGVDDLPATLQVNVDRLANMLQLRRTIIRSVDDHFTVLGDLSGVRDQVVCDLFALSNTSRTQPASIPIDLWNQISLEFIEYQNLRSQF